MLKAGAIALVGLIGLRERSLLLWHRQTDLKALHHRALAVKLEVGEILWLHLTDLSPSSSISSSKSSLLVIGLVISYLNNGRKPLRLALRVTQAILGYPPVGVTRYKNNKSCRGVNEGTPLTGYSKPRYPQRVVVSISQL